MTTSTRKQITQIMSMALCVFVFVGFILVGTANVAHCASAADTIKGIVNNLAGQGYAILRAIIIPCCIVALAAAGFQFIAGGNQGSEKARKTVIAVGCAVAFVVFAPVVVNLIGTAVKDQGSGNINNYNPL